MHGHTILKFLNQSLTLHVLYGTWSVCTLSPGACHGIHFKLNRIFTSSVSGINISRFEVFTVKLLRIQFFCVVVSCGWVRSSNVEKDHIAFNFRIKQLKQPAWSRRWWQYYPSKPQNISPNNTPHIVIIVVSILSEPDTYLEILILRFYMQFIFSHTCCMCHPPHPHLFNCTNNIL